MFEKISVLEQQVNEVIEKKKEQMQNDIIEMKGLISLLAILRGSSKRGDEIALSYFDEKLYFAKFGKLSLDLHNEKLYERLLKIHSLY